jgi:outer membrane protein
MKRLHAPLLALLGAALLAASAMAQDVTGKAAGTLLLRGRLIDVIPQSSDSSSNIGGHVDVSTTLAPEIGLSWFFTDNIAVELMAAASRHTVRLNGTTLGNIRLGTAWVLPPSLTAQYHFMPKELISPYVGAGVNYTFFTNTEAGPGLRQFSLTNNVGGVLQAGVDVAVGTRTWVNIDVKQVFLHTDVKANGGAIRARTDFNPTVVGAGLAIRF